MHRRSREKCLIVNADDFGFSDGITAGILQAHVDGVVTSTSLVANMPAAERAVAQLREVPNLGVGVHLNVSQGPPCSADGRLLAGADGRMDRTGLGVILNVVRHPRLLRAIEAEFEAQIRWTLDRGLRPTHLDTHRHIHAFPPVFGRVARLARKYDIPFVRRYREVLRGEGWPAASGRQRLLSRVLDLFGAVDRAMAPRQMVADETWGIAHTGRIDRAFLLAALRSLPAGATEIVAHPGLPGDLDPRLTRLLESRRAELEALCDPAVAEEIRIRGIRLVHYGQL